MLIKVNEKKITKKNKIQWLERNKLNIVHVILSLSQIVNWKRDRGNGCLK